MYAHSKMVNVVASCVFTCSAVLHALNYYRLCAQLFIPYIYKTNRLLSCYISICTFDGNALIYELL